MGDEDKTSRHTDGARSGPVLPPGPLDGESPGHGLGAASKTLQLLNAQADAVRSDLASLRRELVKARDELNGLRSARLKEANEELVLAAVRADSVAQTAVSSLGELARFNRHDELTGAPNRALLLDRLESAIALAQRRTTRVGVLFVDLDRFKRINDSFGHAVGDEVLRVVTRRLESAVRDSDTVSRHSGDEFLILLAEITTVADAKQVAQKIQASLAAPAQIGPHTLALSASIGIAVYPEDGADPARLIKRADASMYRSKRPGPGTHAFHIDERDECEADAFACASEARPTRPDSLLARHESQLLELSNANHELLQAAQTAQQLKTHAEEAHRRQIAFVAKAAHAMRTPLSTIGTSISLLSCPATDRSTMTRRQEVLDRQVKQLARLIDDLLDGSLVGGGEFKLECSNLDVDAIVGVAVEACRHAIGTRRQRLHFQPAGRAATIRGDPVRLTQVFSNLLNHSSRRAPEAGDVWLTTATVGDEITISTADNGAAIPSEALPKVFDLFVVDDHITAEDPGLGIGLAVVKELVMAHGGSVAATSRAGQPGAEFTIRLPLLAQAR
jgi:diguanylate cyclase